MTRAVIVSPGKTGSQHSMRNRSPEARRLCELLIDVNRIVIVNDVSKRLYVCLPDCSGDFGAVADVELHKNFSTAALNSAAFSMFGT